jgi:hypothetical protein
MERGDNDDLHYSQINTVPFFIPSSIPVATQSEMEEDDDDYVYD